MNLKLQTILYLDTTCATAEMRSPVPELDTSSHERDPIRPRICLSKCHVQSRRRWRSRQSRLDVARARSCTTSRACAPYRLVARSRRRHASTNPTRIRTSGFRFLGIHRTTSCFRKLQYRTHRRKVRLATITQCQLAIRRQGTRLTVRIIRSHVDRAKNGIETGSDGRQVDIAPLSHKIVAVRVFPGRTGVERCYIGALRESSASK